MYAFCPGGNDIRACTDMQAHFEAYQAIHRPEMPTITRDSTGSQSRKDFRVGDR